MPFEIFLPEKECELIKRIIYLLITAALIGPNFLSFKLAERLHIFPYRIILLAAFCFLAIRFFSGRIPRSKIGGHVWFFILWNAYAFSSFFWARDVDAAIREGVFLFFNTMLLFLIIYYFKTIEDFERFYNLWLFILFVQVGIGLWNKITGHQLVDYYGADEIASYKLEILTHAPRGTFRNTNDYASYLALSMPFLLALIRYTKNIAVRLWAVITFLACAYLIIYTFSRVNYIAVLIGFVFWYLFLTKAFSTKVKIVWLIMALGLAAIFFSKEIKNTGDIFWMQLMSLLGKTVPDGSVSVRVNLIKNSILFFLNSFGMGIGAGNTEYYMKHCAVFYTGEIINAHNWWFKILGEYGLFVFLGYLFFYTGVITSLYKMHKLLKTSSAKKISEALLVSLVVFVPASLAPSSIMNLLPQWLLFGFCLGFLNYCLLQKEER